MNSNTPPQAPQLPSTLNAIRNTYINLFNQILDNSININCICKTTLNRSVKSLTTRANKRVKFSNNNRQQFFDKANFLTDDEDDDSEEVDPTDFSTVSNYLKNLDFDESTTEKSNSKQVKICDLNCFERMHYVHSSLKQCLLSQSQEEQKKNMEQLWASFRFLSRCPTSCDYYGTTIFHYAATDDNSELLEFCLEKFPNGVKCIDSKGKSYWLLV
jgi:hypothetical protein